MSEEAPVSLLLVLSTCVVGVAAMSLLAYTLFRIKKLKEQDIPREKLQEMFIPPKEREMYLKRREEGAPEDELRQRLMARALATIAIREQHRGEAWKAEQLYKRGMLHSDQHQIQKIVTDYINSEMQEISMEVEEFTPGATQSFWQQAHAVYHHQMRQRAMAEAQGEQQPGQQSQQKQEQKQEQQELSQEEKQRLADKLAEELVREEEREKARKRKSKNNKK